MSTEETEAPRPLTAEELAGVLQSLRELKQWSQETLAALSGLSLSAVQQIEDGEPSDANTRCALAMAFQFEDIHAFNRPYDVPSPQEIAQAKAVFYGEHLDLATSVAGSGRELAQLFEGAAMDCSAPTMKLAEEATQALAELVQCLREHRDGAELSGDLDKLERYAEIQRYLDALDAMGVSLCYACRDTKLVGYPSPITVVYLAAYPKGHEPEHLIVPRRIRIAR
jgi:transcriptional regulator with XRE-family HTH domain